MPGINELLGKQTENKDNPLQDIQDAGNAEEPKSSSKKLNEDTLKEMMLTGDNTAGLFEPDPDELLDENDKAHEEVDKDAKVSSSGKVISKGKKYIKLFKDELEKNPDEFFINTPSGRMTVKDAIRRGFNPETGDFEEQTEEDKLNGMLEGLNDADKQGIAELINPARASIPPADAQKYGLDPTNEMVQAQSIPVPQEQNGVPLPADAAQIPAVPQDAQTQAQAPQGIDIAALLGGNQL